MFIRQNKSNDLPIKPIICPRCKSKEINTITEYHKSLLCRTIKTILLIIITWIVFSNIKNILAGEISNIAYLFFVLIPAFFLTEIAQQIIESKTHIQCICKDCGNHWLHDE